MTDETRDALRARVLAKLDGLPDEVLFRSQRVVRGRNLVTDSVFIRACDLRVALTEAGARPDEGAPTPEAAPLVEVCEETPPRAPDKFALRINRVWCADFEYENEAQEVAGRIRSALRAAASPQARPEEGEG